MFLLRPIVKCVYNTKTVNFQEVRVVRVFALFGNISISSINNYKIVAVILNKGIEEKRRCFNENM